MGEVALQYRILPEGLDVNLDAVLDAIAKALPQFAKMKASEKKPLAFGLQALHVLVVLEDREGGAEQIESAMGDVPGVQSVEIVEMGLL